MKDEDIVDSVYSQKLSQIVGLFLETHMISGEDAAKDAEERFIRGVERLREAAARAKEILP